MSSKFEGLPNVLIESQKYGVPIISSNCSTGPNEILMNGKLGELFSVGDYHNLANKLLDFSKSKKNLRLKSVYAKKYFPGVTPPSNKFGFPSPIVDGNKASRPYWNDAPNSWPFPTYDASPEIRKTPIPPPQEATVVSR